jgi:NAD(P)H dehydrogenase (quinone)
MDAQMSSAHGVLSGLTESKVAFISRDYIATATAGLLLNEGHEDAITGSESLTGVQRAELIAKASGKPSSFIKVSVETLQDQLQQGWIPTEVVNLVLSSQKDFSNGCYDIVTENIKKLTGRPARSLASILSITTFQ